MRRLTKLLSTLCFLSVLCSSVVNVEASAEETTSKSVVTTNLVTTIKEVKTTIDDKAVTSVKSNENTVKAIEQGVNKEISISALDKNDYLYVEDGNAFFTAKKKGYYAISRNILGLWYGKFDDETQKNKEGYANYEDAFLFEEYEKDAEMTNMSITGDADFYIAYSKNGTDVDAVLKVKPQEIKPIIPESCISAVAELVEETSKHAVVAFNITASEGYSLTDIVLYKEDEDGKIYYDTDSVLGKSAVNFEYEFLENGEYKMMIYASDGSYFDYNISVVNIEDAVDNIDEFVDTTAPKLTVTTDDLRNLEDGKEYHIRVKADEKCNIYISNQAFYDVTSAEGVVLTNGVYEVKAVDSWGNATVETVEVKAFGDGTLPQDIVPLANVNENPLNLSNKDSFWEDAAANQTDDEGSGSVLPQTGSPLWFSLVTGGAVVLIAGGFIGAKKSGILKRKRGMKDEK